MLGILYRSVLRYRIPSILYAIHYGTEYQAYCMQYTTVQNAKHTVCNTLRYRMPIRSVFHTVCLAFCTVVYCIQYAWHSVTKCISYSMQIHYGTECQSFCMKYTTVQKPSILYAIHYGTECQAYCMKYTS
jgi:hypothetical protein